MSWAWCRCIEDSQLIGKCLENLQALSSESAVQSLVGDVRLEWACAIKDPLECMSWQVAS